MVVCEVADELLFRSKVFLSEVVLEGVNFVPSPVKVVLASHAKASITVAPSRNCTQLQTPEFDKFLFPGNAISTAGEV